MSHPPFELSADFPVLPEAIFDAWLSSEGHAAMTGAEATASAEEGGSFTAWDGYISGTNVELRRPDRVVLDWRTADFSDDEPDSRVTLTLTLTGSRTRVDLRHENLPAHGGRYEQGWVDFYFTPMRAHFGG